MVIFKHLESIKPLLSSKLSELEILIKNVEKSLEKAPKGTLKATVSNGVIQYFIRHESTGEIQYLSVAKKGLAKALAQKEYDKNFFKLATKQRRQIKKVLENIPDTQLSNAYDKLSSKKKMLVEPYIMPDDKYVEKWQAQEYKAKRLLDDEPFLITDKGERVRSKSEKIIADKLYSMGIPYRYECPVKLKGLGTVYPDFTILNVRTRKEIYYEHLGMMDKEEYCQKAISKIEHYGKNGIYIGKNLIVTFETSKQPLNMMVVEQMLKEILFTSNFAW